MGLHRRGQEQRHRRERPVAGVGRNVFVLGLTSLLTDLSSEIVYPLLPIFLTTVLGAPLSAVGLIEGTAESTAGLLKAASGWLSDRMRRRLPLTIAGYGVSALTKPLLALASAWPQVMLLRFGDRLGKGIRTAPRDALIADSTAPARRGRSFGFHRAMDTLGAVMGSLAALAALALAGERFRLIFLLASIPALVGVAALLLVREQRSSRPAPAARERGHFHFSGRFKLFLAAAAVFALGNSSDAFVILRARNLGLSSLGAVAAYVLFNLVYAALSMPAGSLSDRLGRKNVVIAGFLFFSLVYLGFALAGGAAAVWPLFAAYSVYMAMTEGVTKAFTTDLAPAGGRGTALGAFHAVTGVLALPSSLVAGLLWDRLGAAAPFYLGAATGLAAALMLLVFLRQAGDRPRSGGLR